MQKLLLLVSDGKGQEDGCRDQKQGKENTAHNLEKNVDCFQYSVTLTSMDLTHNKCQGPILKIFKFQKSMKMAHIAKPCCFQATQAKNSSKDLFSSHTECVSIDTMYGKSATRWS